MSELLDGFSDLIFNIYEAFTVALFFKEHSNLKCLSSVTFAGSFDSNKNILVEGTLPGWVIKHNEPLIIPNFDKDESTLGYYSASEGIKSFMGYPLEGKGVIVVDSKKKWNFTDKEKKILGAFASMLHKEIEKEKKSLEMKENIEELSAERRIVGLFNKINFSKISLKELISECLGISGADLFFTCIEKGGRIFIHDFFGFNNEGYVKKECSSSSISSMVMERGRELLLPHNSNILREKPLFFPGEILKVKQFFGFPLTNDDMVIGIAGFVCVSHKGLSERSIRILRNVSALFSMYFSYSWMKENLERLRDIELITDSIQFPVFLEIIENIAKKGDKLFLLSIKLKNISSFNKYRGLSYTNNLLKKVFKIIRYCVGDQAIITRKSGGHFYVLIKRTNENIKLENIIRILDHTIKKALAEENIQEISCTMETGMASLPEDGMVNIWELINKAEGKNDC